MSHPGYISTQYIEIAKKFKSRDIEIGPRALIILGYFATNDKISTYQIYSEFKKKEKTAYKNVHKIVQRLYKLGLINTTKGKGAEHGAKYYVISEQGLFYLFLRYDKFEQGIFYLSERYDKSLSWVESTFYKCFTLKEDSKLLQSFLYTYFSKETFSALESFSLTQGELNARKGFVWNIVNYLQNCCRDVNEFIRWLERPTWPTLADEWPEYKYLLNLIDSFISLFSLRPPELSEEYQEVLKILLKDNKFAEIVDFVYQDLRKGYESYMDLRSKIY